MKFIAAIKALVGHGKLRNPSGVIVHATAGRSGQSSIEWLAKIGYSYHYIIDRDGEIIVGVPKDQIAYHAGKSVGWQGPNCNSYTIGIAFANMDDGKDPITKAQLESLGELVDVLKVKVPTLKYISTHKWVSPGRKIDPVLWSPVGNYQGLRVWK